MMDLSASSSAFKQEIRCYNSSLSLASFGAQLSVPVGRGPYTFRIHGQIYHQSVSLHPQEKPKYAQLYIMDTESAIKERMTEPANCQCSQDLMTKLEQEIRKVNPFVASYRMMSEYEKDIKSRFGEAAAANVRMYMTTEYSSQCRPDRRYSAPVTNEIAIVFVSNEDGSPPGERDICIYPRNNNKQQKRVSSLSPHCDPMVYPLLFPSGTNGWSITDNHSQLQYYAYRLCVRAEFSPLHYACKLLQQFIVDAYVKIEGSRLSWIRSNQKQLRVDSYLGLMDHINSIAESEGVSAGIPVVLPSTFIGSARHMQQNFQDAMAIVRMYGKPDLFITFTCNPKWLEIQNNLLGNQRAEDRPDLVARVFDIKRKALLHDLLVTKIFGNVAAYIYVIEFQKRGLPRMHLLLHLQEPNKIRDVHEIDKIVCAEIPDKQTNCELYEIVKSSMVHGPCGHFNVHSPCMQNGKCTKNYPREFQTDTSESDNGYPLYRRRIDNQVITLRNIDVDNRWIVPYNPYLTKKFQAHINVEICSTVQAVKYLYKYIYKGHDCANIHLSPEGNALRWDEISTFINTRYVSAPESVWRILEKPMSEKSHSIVRLAVHLEDMQPVFFNNDDEQSALLNAIKKDTHLTAWFKLNQMDSNAHDLLYTEIPKYYIFENCKWKRRSHMKRGCNVIPRMYSVSPKDIERYHLRLLLMHVTAATCFADLRTFETVVYDTFKEACIARGLLADDSEWFKAMDEASTTHMPRQLRQLFCFICVFCQPKDPLILFNSFRLSLLEDLLPTHDMTTSMNKAILEMEVTLGEHNMTLGSFGFTVPMQNRIVTEIIDYDLEQQEGARLMEMLNQEQKLVYDKVMAAIIDDNLFPRVFTVNAPGGAGKSFLFNTILATVIGMRRIVISTAWTGLAATLLKNGRTCHSIFKLPIPLSEKSICNVKQRSNEGKCIRDASVIIIDECTMAPKFALSAINRLLQDMTDNLTPFGGKVIILGGDWRQNLPIEFHANKAKILDQCLKSYPLWQSFTHLSLEQNMRAEPEEKAFADWLLELGNGSLKNAHNLPENVIEIPEECVVAYENEDSILTLIKNVFGNDWNNYSPEQMVDRAILCPKNEDTLKINDLILSMIPGIQETYYSADTAIVEDEGTQVEFPLEFLNSLTPSGMPPHKLALKVGAIVMLLRNMNTKKGLCNGTRLKIIALHSRILEAEIVDGRFKGDRVFIPRIALLASDNHLPFQLRRTQFPIRLSFCITITKAQGQSFTYVGIYLPSPVFTHGQLYVAFSRGRRQRNVKVLVKNSDCQGTMSFTEKVFTKNVFQEIFSM